MRSMRAEVLQLRNFTTLLLAAALLFATQMDCHASSAPPDNGSRIKVALYLDLGCKGGGVIHWA